MEERGDLGRVERKGREHKKRKARTGVVTLLPKRPDKEGPRKDFFRGVFVGCVSREAEYYLNSGLFG